MILKNVFVAMLGTMLAMSSSLVMADEYRPDELLGLDLAKAVLSAKRLGPTSEFAPVAVEARTDPGSEGAQARGESKAHANSVVPGTTPAHIRAEKPRGAARTRLARSHGNPLDAEARDTRIQVWPCKSGGICDWQKQKN
jgi:hypothetical protein